MVSQMRCKATVELKVRIEVDSVWSFDTTVQQVHDQAKADAKGILDRLSREHGQGRIIPTNADAWVVFIESESNRKVQ